MLSPYRVLDLCDGNALIAGQVLGDLGADVVVIEPPGGASLRNEGPFVDGQPHPDRSLAWWAVNRNKRSATIDITTPEGRDRFLDLARTADVVFEAYPPGHLDSLGLGYSALSAVNPGIILASITPFGQDGPKAHWPSADLTAYASSGALIMSGDADRPPASIPVPQAYLHAGAEAAVGALLALHAREQGGPGQHVDVSAQTAAMMATQATILNHGWGDAETTRMAGGVNFGGIPLKFVQPAADGFVSVTFLFGTAIGPFTRRLFEVMCEEGVVDEATRDKDWLNYTALILSGQEPITEFLRCSEAIGQFTSRHTKAELFQMALDRDILIVPVSTLDEVANSEQLASRNFWQEVDHPELGRRVKYPGPFARTQQDLGVRHRPPTVGEHTAEVLAEAASRSARPSSGAAGPALPLEGIKVLDFMWVVAGPWATRYLADYGATVIKVESPLHVDTSRTIAPFKDHVPGPERSGLYCTVNAGKMAMGLNLGTEAGRDIILRLVKWADIITDSFAAGALKKFGLDYDSVKKVNPGIIMLSSCLNGQTGPHARLAGFGTMGLHLAGFGDTVGWPDRPPAGAAGAYTDYIAPKFTAAALLAALDHRRRTGEGQYIDFSQAEAASHFLAPALLHYFVNGVVETRRGNRSPNHSPHAVFPAAGDDRWVAIVCTNDDQWNALANAAGHPEWLSDVRFATLADRLTNADALEEAIAGWSATVDVDALEQTLAAAGVPCHRATTSSDAFRDPQLASRGHFITVTHPEVGQVPIEASRLRLSRTPARIPTAGPTMGQHNQVVLKDILGLSDEELIEVVAGGALE